MHSPPFCRRPARLHCPGPAAHRCLGVGDVPGQVLRGGWASPRVRPKVWHGPRARDAAACIRMGERMHTLNHAGAPGACSSACTMLWARFPEAACACACSAWNAARRSLTSAQGCGALGPPPAPADPVKAPSTVELLCRPEGPSTTRHHAWMVAAPGEPATSLQMSPASCALWGVTA